MLFNTWLLTKNCKAVCITHQILCDQGSWEISGLSCFTLALIIVSTTLYSLSILAFSYKLSHLFFCVWTFLS